MGLSGWDFLTLASSVTISSAFEVEFVLLSLILISFPLLKVILILLINLTFFSHALITNNETIDHGYKSNSKNEKF